MRGSLNSCLNRHGTATAPGLRRSPQQGCSQLLQDSAEARTPEEASTRPWTSTAAVHWSTSCCCRKKDEGAAATNEDEDSSDDQESKDNDDDSSDDEAATEGDDFSELTFAVDDNVRVWWPNEDPPAWFDGVVEKVCTIMLKVNYPDTGDWQHHDPTKWKIEKR